MGDVVRIIGVARETSSFQPGTHLATARRDPLARRDRSVDAGDLMFAVTL
jgi:hypothetical protein